MIYEPPAGDQFNAELKKCLLACNSGDTIIVPEHKQIAIAQKLQGEVAKDKHVTINSFAPESEADKAKRLDEEAKNKPKVGP